MTLELQLAVFPQTEEDNQKLYKEKYDASFLVRPNEDIYGRAKYESLTNRFDIKEISYIKRGVIWNINSKIGNLNDEINSILTTNIFFNPHCYEYYEIKK